MLHDDGRLVAGLGRPAERHRQRDLRQRPGRRRLGRVVAALLAEADLARRSARSAGTVSSASEPAVRDEGGRRSARTRPASGSNPAGLDLGERRCGPVAVGEHELDIVGPLEREIRVERPRCRAPGRGRRRRAEVADRGLVGQRDEGVPEPLGQVERPPVDVVEQRGARARRRSASRRADRSRSPGPPRARRSRTWPARRHLRRSGCPGRPRGSRHRQFVWARFSGCPTAAAGRRRGTARGRPRGDRGAAAG